MKAVSQDALVFTPPDAPRAKEPPLIFALLYIALVAVAGMGDMGSLAGGLGTYMKVLPVGAVGLAGLWFLMTGSFRRLKEIGAFAFLFLLPLLLTLLLSLLIWAIHMEPLSAISRGSQKLLFQFLNILSVLSAAYLFGRNVLKYFFFGLAGANSLIALLEMKRYGVGASIQSVIDGLVGGGDAYGFMAAMEIHDITFAMGLLALYYLCVECRTSPAGRVWALISMGYFILGYKRIAFLGFGAGFFACLLLGKLPIRARVAGVRALSWALALIAFGYVVFIKTGGFFYVTNLLGIDTMGRTKIYTYINEFYEIDPTYAGYGFEYIVAMLRGMKAEGTQVVKVTGMHNDILKQYIELGFWGFWAWALLTYVYQPGWFLRRYGEKAARMVLTANIYTFVTYMTDNTIYYFWLSMTLRMAVIGFAFSDEIKMAVEKEYRERGTLSRDEARELAEEIRK